MRTLLVALMLVGFSGFAQDTATERTEKQTAKTQTVEASCGQCQFGLTGGGCDLAVKIDGQAYYVDGSTMGDHGDAHAHDGMCMKIRTAEVAGEVKDGKFLATSFVLLPEVKK
jgi:hypothetical protein